MACTERAADSVATIPGLVSSISSIASTHASSHTPPNHIDAEFIESEALYVAALETLLYAYIQPLANIQQLAAATVKKGGSSPTSTAALADTFGADVMQMISCHSYILHRLGNGNSRVSPSGLDGTSKLLFPTVTMTTSSEASPSTRGTSLCTSVDAVESFPSVLLQMTPMLAEVYERYITNFDAHIAEAEHARSRVPDAIWCASYSSLAQLTIRTKAANWLCATSQYNGVSGSCELPPDLETMLCTFDTSFSALVALPAQRIARYSLLIQEWVKAQREVDCAVATASLLSPPPTLQMSNSIQTCHILSASDDDSSSASPNASPSTMSVASPFRSCRVEEYRNAIAAAARLHTICETVNHIRSSLEATKELVHLERQLGISNGGLSLHTGQLITLRSRLTKYKCKGPGHWHPKPCYAILLETLLIVVECFDESRRKCKRLHRIPLMCVNDVYRLSIAPSKFAPLDVDRGFAVRYRPGGSRDSKGLAGIFSRSKESHTEDGLTELVLLDDDYGGRELWMQELPVRISLSASESSQ